MILSCNSCGKKFVVPDQAITSSGRMVQCGSCGNKWKQFPVKSEINEKNQSLIEKIYGKDTEPEKNTLDSVPINTDSPKISKLEPLDKYSYAETIEEEEPLSLHEKELEMIKQALIRSKGKRKLAAQELGISERTLYRKIKQFDLNEPEKI